MGDSKPSSKRNSANGSCIPTGVQESEESGDESEPTYRHYDHFETDVCLTQDEDEPLPSNVPIIQTPKSRRSQSQDQGTRDTFSGVNANRAVSSDSDSCTETEMPDRVSRRDTDGTTTTTSTSESEETQIWVPVSKRPSTIKQGTNTPPRSTRASSSNDSDGQGRQPTILPASLPASVGLTTGSLSIIASPGAEIKVKDDARRGSAQNTMSSVISKRGVTSYKPMSLGLLRHDEATGTITLDIHNVQNGDIDTDHTDDRDYPTEEIRARYQKVSTDPGHKLNDDICSLLSILYADVMIITGLGIAVAEVHVTNPMPSLFEGFHVFLLIASITFLVFAFSYTVKVKTLSSDRVIVTRRTTQKAKRGFIDEGSDGFYLRLGAVFFGIASMIKSGLHFGESFEMTKIPECDNVLHAIRPMVQIVFTFTQLYFVFFSSKMSMHHYRCMAKFGLMHMVATNICIWFDNVVKETLRSLNQPAQGQGQNITDVVPVRVGADCYGDSLMGEVIRTSGPYLYPCAIQYSFIAASLLFVMWYKIETGTCKPTMQKNDQENSENKADIECSSSSRGLFLGIIVLVAIVITTITFFVLVQTTAYTTHALRLGHITDIIAYVIMITSILLAFYRMNWLKYYNSGGRFEHSLLLGSLVGVYILCISNIIAGGFYPVVEHGILLGLASMMQLIEASVQYIFLKSAGKRTAKTREQERDKPGREFVTFVLICNIAVWGLNMFIAQRWKEHGMQRAFYGDVSWNIILHMAEPLSLFFRFLSTVLLVQVWMFSWKPDCGPE